MKPIKALLWICVTVIVSGTFVEHARHKRTINLINGWTIPHKYAQGAQMLGNPVTEKRIQEYRQLLPPLPNSQYPIYKIHKYNGIHVKPITAQEIVPKILHSTHRGSSSIVGANLTPIGYLPSNTYISRPRINDLPSQPPNNQGRSTLSIQNQVIKGIFPFKSLPELPSLPEAQLFQVPSNINPYPHQTKVAYKLKTVHHLSVPLKEDIGERTIKIDSFNKFNPIVVEQTNNLNEEDNPFFSDNVLSSASEKHEVVVNLNGNPVNNPTPSGDNEKDSKQHNDKRRPTNEKSVKVPPRRFTPSRKRYPNSGNNS